MSPWMSWGAALLAEKARSQNWRGRAAGPAPRVRKIVPRPPSTPLAFCTSVFAEAVRADGGSLAGLIRLVTSIAPAIRALGFSAMVITRHRIRCG
jgi:hypothetical protein